MKIHRHNKKAEAVLQDLLESGTKEVISPIPFRPRAASTAAGSTERQSEQIADTQQRDIRNSALGPYGVRHHPYPHPQHWPWPFNGGPHPYFYPEIGSFVEGIYPYRSPLSPDPHPSARQDQWTPGFPPFTSAVRAPFAALEPFRYDIFVQEERVGHSGRKEEASASVPVGAVQQNSIWRPHEESTSSAVLPQAQTDNPDEDIDVDVEN